MTPKTGVLSSSDPELSLGIYQSQGLLAAPTSWTGTLSHPMYLSGRELASHSPDERE